MWIGYYTGREVAEELVAELSEGGCRATSIELDVRDRSSVDQAVKVVFSEDARIDALINCAGVTRDGLALGLTESQWAEVLDVNAAGSFRLVRAVARYMMRKRAGSVVLLSSVAAQGPGKGHANYAASKGAVEAMTRAFASELAGRGIRVNAVAPGIIVTPMSDAVRASSGDVLKGEILQGRFGEPAEVAAAVAFLASSDASYITAQVLEVAGGFKV